MIFEDVFRQMLIDANVTDRRVFLMRAPQKKAEQQTTPYMVFFHVGPEPMHQMQGPLSPMIRVYQVSIFDPSQTRALGIADSLRGKLDGFRGTYQGVLFGGVFYHAQTSTYELQTQLIQVIVEFRIIFRWLDLPSARFHPSSKPSSNQRSNESE